MKDFGLGALTALIAYVVLMLIWSIQISMVVSDCEKLGMFIRFDKIYECRELKK